MKSRTKQEKQRYREKLPHFGGVFLFSIWIREGAVLSASDAPSRKQRLGAEHEGLRPLPPDKEVCSL